MICRLLQDRESVRVGDLSHMLHVKPSSVTKMIQHLSLSGYLRAEKYGEIYLTDKGRSAGGYLLYRTASSTGSCARSTARTTSWNRRRK